MEEKSKKKRLLWLLLLIPVVFLASIITLIALLSNSFNEDSYKRGVEKWEAGQYSSAIKEFHDSGLRHDSQDYVDQFEDMVRPELVKYVWCGEDKAEFVGSPSSERHASWRLWFYEDGTCIQEIVTKEPTDSTYSVKQKTTMYWDLASTDDNFFVQLRLDPGSKVTASYTCNVTEEDGQPKLNILYGTFYMGGQEMMVGYVPFTEDTLVIH